MAFEISEIKNEKLQQFSRTWGICSTIQIPGHNFMGRYVESMFDKNNNPEITYKDHYWELVKVCKTNTWNTRWVIRINNTLFSVVQGFIYKIGTGISIYNTTDSKNGDCNLANQIKSFPMIVDMETACDYFAAEYMAQRILDGRFDNIINKQQ